MSAKILSSPITKIISDLCNHRRNSDIRADDKELRQLLDAHDSALRDRIEQQERILRRVLESGQHIAGCAKYGYAGTHCSVCGIGQVHADGSICLPGGPPEHKWVTVPESPCDCYLAEVQRAIAASPETPKQTEEA